MAEIFGPTFQGEGRSAGQVAAFVRLSRCNLECTWCDTPYTWDRRHFDLAAESRRMTAGEIWETVAAIRSGLVVITGGEPLLQQRQLAWLAGACTSAGRVVEIETNGTITPHGLLMEAADRFNVGLKLANSGMPERWRLRPAVIRELALSGKATWKFVVTGLDDLDEITCLQQRFGLDPVWVMPEGTSSGQILEQLRQLADPVLRRGWNLSPRLHTLLWESARGR